MDVKVLKRKIYNDDKIIMILEELGMHHINTSNSEYITCGMFDGDNPSSTIVYLDEGLGITAYTRDLGNGATDIISLVCYAKKLYFSKAIKWLTDLCGYNYYENTNENIPKSLLWLDSIFQMEEGDYSVEDNMNLDPIDEEILSRYGRCSNQLFYDDGISDRVQYEFCLGIDMESHSITIPIFDELGSLVGVKARQFTREKVNNKYFALQKFAKTKVLYGLDKSYDHIMNKGEVIVLESEKAVMQMWSRGVKNCVAILGSKLSKVQALKLGKLGVDITFALDQEIGRLEDGSMDTKHFIKLSAKFLDTQPINVMFDDSGLLKEKESPSDNFEAFEKLYENKVVIQ